jgi:adenylate cyclase
VVEAAHGTSRALEEARRRQQVQDLFERYLTRGVAHLLLANPEHLKRGGTVREATVLFMDIREYARWAQQQPPERVMHEVNTLMDEIVPVVEGQRGWVVQYTGDGLLAVFGVPDPVEDHAQKAVAAGIGMVRVSRCRSAAREREGDKPLRVGCGIHTGKVAFGNRGGASRLEVAVVGDTVNVAARLEQLNKEEALNEGFASELIISQETRDRLGSLPPLRGPFQMAIKGHAEPMTIYQVQVCDE